MTKMPASGGSAELDSETAAALTLFNTYLAADRERRAHERRIKKAVKAKDAAAAEINRLAEKGSAAEKAAAETAYREATDAWRKLTDPDSASDTGEAENPADDGEGQDSGEPGNDEETAENEAEDAEAGDKDRSAG